MGNLTKELQEAVKKLFDDDKITLFIGFEKGSLPLTSAPCFIRNKEEVEKLIWDSFCSNNLSVYLPRYFLPDPRNKEKEIPRIGIMVKGCDGRNLVVVSNEKQVPRSSITIVGIACNGVIDQDKLRGKLAGREVVEARDDLSTIIVVDQDGNEEKLDKESVLADPCLTCEDNIPSVSDILIGERVELKKDGDTLVKEFAAKEIEERWQYFASEMTKCIRCYACRQACPLCYCKECFADQTQPRWVGAGTALSDVILFHLGRILHTAGRCVDCGACARACPMGVDLRTFQKQLVESVKEKFGYKPGLSLEEVAPLATFHLEDKQEFITEPK